MQIDKQEFFDQYMTHLNDSQINAVRSIYGPVLLLAVPGSGKTTVLINRLGYMIFCEGIHPESILTLTYTVAATKDMSRRFTSVFGEEYEDMVEFRTINGICSKIISRYGKMIGKTPFKLVTDEKELTRILSGILSRKLSEYPTESDVKNAKTLITYCKNMLLDDPGIKELGVQENLPLLDIFNEYNSYLKENNMMDYDDQMVYAYRMLISFPELLDYYKKKYQYICVDEAQDTSKVQHLIIRLLAGKNGNLFMVGDEDQSIYGFRAAYPEALLNFEKDHPDAKVLIMSQNYRSNANIVSAADAFIQHNQARHNKHMVSTRPAASNVHYIDLKKRANQYGYLVKIAENCETETAVLYRENDSVLPLVDILERKGIPYRIKNIDMSFFSNRIVVDIVNILNFAINPYDTELFMKIYYKCQTYLKKRQAERLCEIAREKGISVLDAFRYAEDLNRMVSGKMRTLKINFANLKKEATSQALFRIETAMGYGEYLRKNNINPGKLFILKMLSYQEDTLTGYLSRLEYLRRILLNSKPDYDSRFILSTIHSSKGLEYRRVYLLDVCDGVFPGTRNQSSDDNQKKKDELEEERRLFYVAVTRAKDELHIFRAADKSSRFIREFEAPEMEAKEKQRKAASMKARKSSVPADYIPAVGDRIVQDQFGEGVITEVKYNLKKEPIQIKVEFVSGKTRLFAFPTAFSGGMRVISSINKN